MKNENEEERYTWELSIKENNLIGLFRKISNLINESGFEIEDLIGFKNFLLNMKDLPLFLYGDPLSDIKNEEDFRQIVIFIDSVVDLMRLNIWRKEIVK